MGRYHQQEVPVTGMVLPVLLFIRKECRSSTLLLRWMGHTLHHTLLHKGIQPVLRTPGYTKNNTQKTRNEKRET